MTMVSTGPISLGGTATTGGLNQSVNVELGRSGTASINMNESAVRTLFGVASGAISMSNGYGKSNQFSFSVTADTSNFNLRSAAIAAGWNQSSRLVCTINSGVTIFSTSTGTPAFTVSGSFPGGVELINNGVILGRGGGGGTGGGTLPGGGGPGAGGGTGLLVQSAISVNNVNRISGGGGGGGGAALQYAGSCGAGTKSRFDDYGKGGGGGGGIGNGSAGAGGGSSCSGSGNPGGAGTLTSAGGGGFGPGSSSGGSGGGYGSSGGGGQQAPGVGSAGGGGSGGAAVSGNSSVTWIALGTRNGGIIP
jgi:hypothetical protein